MAFVQVTLNRIIKAAYDIDIGNKKDNVLFALKVMKGTILIIDQTTYTGENNQ